MCAFENPAQLFLRDNRVESLEDIIAFTNFLHAKSGLSEDPPIDLNAIYQRFGILQPQSAPLSKQQGTTIPIGGIPQIIVKQDDPQYRQRFTQAHELIEMLFTELPGEIRMDRVKETIFGNKKERICQAGAANLLMPQKSFLPAAQQNGISLQTAELLVRQFEVSLTASLFRIADLFPNQAAIILWKMKNKPIELKKEVPENQIAMPGFPTRSLPSPKLRVEWAYGEFMNIFIPQEKSIPEDSSVYRSWERGQITVDEEILPFGKRRVKGLFENIPISINDENCILSLVRKP